MSPPPTRTTQLSLLQFVGSKFSTPATNNPQPRPIAYPPRRATPRPISSTPFFRRQPVPPPSTQSPPKSHPSDIEACQFATDLLCNPPPRAAQTMSDHMPAQSSPPDVAHSSQPVSVCNSDEDFECDATPIRAPSSASTPRKRLPHDRTSMTKRSANKKPYRGLTNSPKGSRHTRSQSQQLFSSSEEEVEDVGRDARQRLIFSGERSEFSDTGDEGSIDSRPIKCPSQPDANIAGAECSPTPHPAIAGNKATLRVRADITLRQGSSSKRVRPFPRLFSSDSLDSSCAAGRGAASCRVVRADGTESSHVANIDKDGSARKKDVRKKKGELSRLFPQDSIKTRTESPATTSERRRALSRVICVDSDSSSLCGWRGEGTERKEGSLAKKRLVLEKGLGIVETDRTGVKGRNVGDDEERLSRSECEIVETGRRGGRLNGGVVITPPSTPSPPSTRKRKRRSRLVTRCSSEEEVVGVFDGAGGKTKEMEGKSGGVGGGGGGVEWFCERDIGEFSSSSGDNGRGVDNGVRKRKEGQGECIDLVDSEESEGRGFRTEVRKEREEEKEDDDKAPPFHLVVLCKEGESVAKMKERMGEEYVMDRVAAAQKAGREIIGGEEIGLTGVTFNRNVFSRFRDTVVKEQIGRERGASSVAERALRGEYQFTYRGRNRERGRGGGGRGRANGRRGSFRRRRRGAK